MNLLKTKVVMVHAPDPVFTIIADFGNRFMPVWSYTLAAMIDKSSLNVEVSLLDTRVNNDINSIEGKIFLYSGINQDLQRILEVSSILKGNNPGSIHIIGGPICWSYDKANELHLLDSFDYIFIGDGEAEINELLKLAIDKVNNIKNCIVDNKVIRAKGRFDLNKALLMDRDLVLKYLDNYYGAVIEISRGCPFLCEFCDIRILSDNNRSHNKNISLIIEELDFFYKQGIRQVILACDNMIGDHKWAEELVDAILKWRVESGGNVVFYTWVTLTISRFDGLMKKMRLAGFDLLFIGVESFSNNSLLETAKLQNISSLGMVDTIKSIQSYGFIVVAGMIIGFDSDSLDVFDETTNGLLQSGILSGDPGMLYALPGTPLFYRMKLANRLRPVSESSGSRQKLHTNMVYILPSKLLKKGWVDLSKKLTMGNYNYLRLKNYLDNLNTGNYIKLDSPGFGNIFLFIKLVLESRAGRSQLFKRVINLLKFENIFYIFKAYYLCFSRRRLLPDYFRYFSFWLFSWSSAIVRYKGIRESDIDIISLDRDVLLEDVLPKGYDDLNNEEIEHSKTLAQRRSTIKSLQKIFYKPID